MINRTDGLMLDSKADRYLVLTLVALKWEHCVQSPPHEVVRTRGFHTSQDLKTRKKKGLTVSKNTLLQLAV